MGEQQLKSALGLKQNYFHLADANYHMIAPLFSSTLSQAIYQKIRASKFDEADKKLREARRKSMYAEGVLSVYPNLAVMNFGGTQPQNITAGNFIRHGEAYLLSCTPPQWQSDLKPPINIKSIFEGEFDRRAWKTAKELQAYLIKLQQKKGNKEKVNNNSHECQRDLHYKIIISHRIAPKTSVGVVPELKHLPCQTGKE